MERKVVFWAKTRQKKSLNQPLHHKGKQLFVDDANNTSFALNTMFCSFVDDANNT